MKSLNLLGVILLCCTPGLQLQAQQTPPLRQILPTKSSLFSLLPNKLLVKNSVIEDLFSGPASGYVKILLAPDHFFEGMITERVQKNENVISVNVKSSNYDGALLTVSKISFNNKEDAYIGRIVSMQYGDVLLLKRQDGQFFFSKEKQSQVIVE